MQNLYKPALLILVFSCSLFTLCRAQAAIEWQNTIGGSGNDWLYYIQQTTDGGYILGGESFSNISGDKTENCYGNSDYWLVKTDTVGNLQWENTIGGSGSETLLSVQQTADGGYILSGYSGSNISGDKTENSIGGFSTVDYWIVKTDTAGNILWQNTIGGSDDDLLFSVQQTTDGGYILGGYSRSNISGDKTENSNGDYDYWVVKIDAAGNIQWQNTIGGSGADYLRSIQQTADGGYILGGYSYSYISGDKTETSIGGSDYWLVKTDTGGNIQWQNTIGGSSYDYFNSIQQTADGGYILGGYSSSHISGDKTENSFGNKYDYWLVITDSLANIQWQNTIGGSGDDQLYTIKQTVDGGYILGGGSNSSISGDKTEGNRDTTEITDDYWIIKTDASGNIQWQKTIGGNNYDRLFSMQQTAKGEYILGGYSFSNISGDKTENIMGGGDYWLVKITEKYNSITGNLFFDFNSNSVYDTGELLLANRKVKEQNTGRFAFSEQNGHYSISVFDTGSYTVAPSPINCFNTVPATQSAYFAGINQTDSLNHFAFQPIGVCNDVCVKLTPFRGFRPGFNAQYIITYENTGTTTLSGSVVFFPDSALSYVSSSITPAAVYTDSVIWNYTSLAPFQTGSILVTVNINSTTPIGTQIISDVRIEPVAGDANPACNHARWQLLTTGSYDPNDILVDEDTLTTIQLAASPSLEYIIRFQNTGNDTAFTVKILNPIDTTKLQISSIEFVSSSHPVNLKWIDYRQNMEFTFADILLPDSNTNELLSHGFVRYRIQPKTSLVAGNTITNSAGIYFDFNEAVLTNTAVTSIVLLSGIPSAIANPQFVIFPNPTSNTFTITIPENLTGQTLTVTDVIGKLVFQSKISNLKSEINVSHWGAGVYFVRVDSRTQKLIIQK